MRFKVRNEKQENSCRTEPEYIQSCHKQKTTSDIFATTFYKNSGQSVTYRYREFPVPGIFAFFLVVSEPVSEKICTGKKYRNRYRKNLVPEKVSEPVSEKFGTGADFCRQFFFNLDDL